ncbi:hypothetical protein HELRODRAFT_159432 [Helobdella robusta]|uniref:Uncharacterized protein n=1 Tax=Helobdella robusta TaxID=6412 RepID=T1EP11_HELRO|nr:hypothetical protein HELRODRAFT_159432 [Helobdella robusta]ESO12844.1 hypothetical protein HELRODRAFT_159432 [Helobdella robusta]
MMQIHSNDVLANARSESLSVDDEDKDDVFDVQVAKRTKKKNILPVLYFDSTGSVIRRTSSKQKRIFHYTGVISIDNRIIPMIDFVTCRHDVYHINQVLIDYKHYVSKKLKEWPLYSNVVTDFSMALIEAVLKGFNHDGNSDVFEYAMKWATSDVIPIKIVQVKLCVWVLRSALNFASDGEVVREVGREFQRKRPKKANADLAKECLTRVASAREQDMEIYEKRKGHEQLYEQQS